MGEIYRLAKTVVVFLGAPPSLSPESSISHLFKFLNRSDDGKTPEEGGDRNKVDLEAPFESCEADKHAVCKDFVELCLRPWWGRI